MQKDNYIVVSGWMCNLGLSLVERTVYAIIYGFSQDGDSIFRGGRHYLAEWCGCTTKTIDAALRSLVEKGLLTKLEEYVGNVKFCRYSANFPTGEIISLPGKFTEKVWKNFPEGMEKISPNNKVDNGDTIVSPNNENKQRARATSKSFDFVGALVGLGVDRTTAENWAATRKKAGATNSGTQLDEIAKQFERAASLYGLTPQDCVACAEVNSWRGFRASWEKVKLYADEKYASNRGAGRVPRYTGDTI